MPGGLPGHPGALLGSPGGSWGALGPLQHVKTHMNRRPGPLRHVKTHMILLLGSKIDQKCFPTEVPTLYKKEPIVSSLWSVTSNISSEISSLYCVVDGEKRARGYQSPVTSRNQRSAQTVSEIWPFFNVGGRSAQNAMAAGQSFGEIALLYALGVAARTGDKGTGDRGLRGHKCTFGSVRPH